MVREKPRKQPIAQLRDHDGTLKSEDHELQEICSRFYSELYAAPLPPAPGIIESALEPVRSKVTAEMRERLGRAFSFEELRDAAEALATDRAPGPDGISIVFYTHH